MQQTAGVHTLVERPDDFDQFQRDQALVKDVARSCAGHFFDGKTIQLLTGTAIENQARYVRAEIIETNEAEDEGA